MKDNELAGDTDSEFEAREEAEVYLGEGPAVTVAPMPAGRKGPVFPGRQRPRVTAGDLADHSAAGGDIRGFAMVRDDGEREGSADPVRDEGVPFHGEVAAIHHILAQKSASDEELRLAAGTTLNLLFRPQDSFEVRVIGRVSSDDYFSLSAAIRNPFFVGQSARVSSPCEVRDCLAFLACSAR
jgi:hypothetical protein